MYQSTQHVQSIDVNFQRCYSVVGIITCYVTLARCGQNTISRNKLALSEKRREAGCVKRLLTAQMFR